MKAEKEKKTKKDKKEKMPLSQVLKYNFLMLKKIAQMTPQYIVFMIVSGIIGGISNSIETIFTYRLFNLLDKPDATFGKAAAYIVLIFVVNTAISLFWAWYYQYYQTVTDKKLQHLMHSELFEQAQKMDLACYDDPKFYNDYVWAMDESKNRAVQVLDDTTRIITYLITISTLVTLMAQVDVVVGIILFIGCIGNAAIWWANDKIYFKRNERTKPYHRKNSYINRVYHLSDYAKELRIGSAGENLKAMYSEGVSGIVEENVKAGKKLYGMDVLSNTIQILARGIPVVMLLFKLYGGTAQLGGFVAGINVIWTLNWNMYDLAQQFIRMPDNAQYISKYVKFMSYKPTIVSGEKKAEPLREIELKNVTFSYNSVEKSDGEVHKSLDNVSLKIKQGEKVAIVGYNGAGKTTLTKLLMRLYDPTDGEVLYNGKNLKDYDIPSIREKIGTVFQDYKIFAATIAENVIGGECTPEMRDTVTDALTKSTFGDKLGSLEKGMDTELTKEFYDDGVNLSGGEAQKVAIARIFARPYELIIMDEPSSALDPSAEYELNHTILEYAQDKTVVFISHRLSTTRMADRILMFDNGRMIESGSHDELMKMNGKYAEMFRLQAEKYHMAE
ncbi:MAG: ABC transporter ATP-binding protein [Eubacteriales bacterium]